MCTGIKLQTKDVSIVYGRTVEFGITIDSTIAFVPRGYEFVGQTPLGDGPKRLAGEVSKEFEQDVWVDGELGDKTPFTVTAMPQALEIVIPA